MIITAWKTLVGAMASFVVGLLFAFVWHQSYASGAVACAMP